MEKFIEPRTWYLILTHFTTYMLYLSFNKIVKRAQAHKIIFMRINWRIGHPLLFGDVFYFTLEWEQIYTQSSTVLCIFDSK